ncbi:hypothetical protein DAPK24_036780 [Pichia kluyveri]|uniref:Pumilio homology domain family member 3 n=1 Tax=Pichia kluyveri TaxID=36015 RepID=A0AAV5R6T1_PICKL|nr:hypothetical protein DAPK24_036780 [Pichia kluyveri]
MTSWNDNYKASSIDESIVSNPWENLSNKGNITNLVAPNPISPIISHNQQDDKSIQGSNNTSNIAFNQSSFLNSFASTNKYPMIDENAISETGSDALRDAISAISAPVATQPLNKSRFGANVFGPSTVAGVNVNVPHFKSSNSTFLEKFSSVTEKTKELESKQLGSRRSSIFNNEPKSPQQLFREPRKQSFSEKLESYISATASPSNSRHLSFSSEIAPVNNNNNNSSVNISMKNMTINNTINNDISNFGSENLSNHENEKVDFNNANINGSNSFNFKKSWNPATATPFQPNYGSIPEMSYLQHQQPMMVPSFPMMGSQGIPNNGFYPQIFPPFLSPQFMMPNGTPNTGAEEMKPSDTTTSQYGSTNSDLDDIKNNQSKTDFNNQIENGNQNKVDNNNNENKDSTENLNNNSNNNNHHPDVFPVTLSRSGSPFIMAPFNPYGMFPPPTGSSFISSPGSPIGAVSSPPPPGMMMPMHMMGVAPVGPRDGKGTTGTPPNKNSRSPISSSGSKKNGGNGNYKSNKFNKNKHIVRSPLLEEFRSNKDSKKYTLKDIASHGYEFAKDQHGSRFIQHELEIASEEDKEIFFKEIRNNSVDLITDVFGNYVIQKYFEFGSSVQKKVLFESMRGSFNNLSVQMYGCRVVQKCLEGIPLVDQLDILEELRPNILNLVKDQNGNHVIQKAIEKIPIEKIPFILDSLRQQIYHLSMHPYGCRVIQRLLECSNIEDQEFILDEVKNFIYYLVQDQFGNYVIQHVIESGKKKDTDIILKVVKDNLIELSKHKFASNAVEKCIINLPKESRIEIYETMLKDNLSEEGELNEQSKLMLMMKDPFANYVVQKMVEIVDDSRKKFLVMKVRQYLKLIQKSSNGKHLASIEKLNNICRNYD